MEVVQRRDDIRYGNEAETMGLVSGCMHRCGYKYGKIVKMSKFLAEVIVG